MAQRFNIQFDVDASGAVRGFKQYEAGARRSGKASKDLTRQQVALKAGLLGVGVVGALLARKIISTASSFQGLRTQLETVTGSAARAASAFSQIQEFASKTPFQVENITTAFIRLKAVGIEPTSDLMQSIGNTAAAFGKDITEFAQAVVGASTGEMEMLKQFGIVAKQQGDIVRFTFKGVTTEVGKNADEIVAFLQKIGATEFAGGMERQSKTLAGTFSTLKDELANLADAFATESGLIDVLTDSVRTMTHQISAAKVHFEEINLAISAAITVAKAMIALKVASALLAWGTAAVTAARSIRSVSVALSSFSVVVPVLIATGAALELWTKKLKAAHSATLRLLATSQGWKELRTSMLAGLTQAAATGERFKVSAASVDILTKRLKELGKTQLLSAGDNPLKRQVLNLSALSGETLVAANEYESLRKILLRVSTEADVFTDSMDAAAPATSGAAKAVDELKKALEAAKKELADLEKLMDDVTSDFESRGIGTLFAGGGASGLEIPIAEFKLTPQALSSLDALGDEIAAALDFEHKVFADFEEWINSLPIPSGPNQLAKDLGAAVSSELLFGIQDALNGQFDFTQFAQGMGAAIGHALGGPIGAQIGSILGSIIGSIFGGGGGDKVVSQTSFGQRTFGGPAGRGRELDQPKLPGFAGGGTRVGGNIQEIADALAELEAIGGGLIEVLGNVNIKVFESGRILVEFANGVRGEFMDMADAISFALGQLLESAEFKGFGKAFQEILDAGGSGESILEKFRALAGVLDELAAMNPAADIKAMNDKFSEMRAVLEGLGLTSDALAKLLAQVAVSEAQMIQQLKNSELANLLGLMEQAGIKGAKAAKLTAQLRQAEFNIQLEITRARLKELGILKGNRVFLKRLARFGSSIGNFIAKAASGGGGGGGRSIGGFKVPSFDRVSDSLNSHEQEMERLRDAFQNAIGKLLDFRKSLDVASFAPIRPEQRLFNAKAQFQDVLRLAQGGGVDAINKLPEVSKTLLDIAQGFFGSTSGFKTIFSQVKAALDGVLGLGGVSVSSSSNPVVASLDGFKQQAETSSALQLGMMGSQMEVLQSNNKHLASLSSDVASMKAQFERMG